MGCEICGRGGCTASFHSIEEQRELDDKKEQIAERMSNNLSSRINSLEGEWIDDMFYIKKDAVDEIIASP